MLGRINQNMIIKKNQSIELMRKAIGLIFRKKKSAADTMANTFTTTIITLISRRLIK